MRAAREFLLSQIERARGHDRGKEIWSDDLSEYHDGEYEDGPSVPNLVLTYEFPDNILLRLDGEYDGNHHGSKRF